ncbi:ABC transporter permease [Nonomuraea sp. NPDC050790]|uniref:ABC transporter permease n=1 Tax=Nonomuraea sp. NPDC050790 TaxID=3364371 RepID=UPI003794B47D
MMCLAACLAAVVTGSVLIVTAWIGNGTESGRLTQCFSSERMDLAVLPAGFPAQGTPPPIPTQTIAALRTIPGVSAVREVRGGTVHASWPQANATPMEVVALPANGLPMLPVIGGRPPAAHGEAVVDEETAASYGLGVGSTVTVTDPRGALVDLRVSGVLQVDMNKDMIVRGTLGLTPQTAATLVSPIRLSGLQVTLDSASLAGPVRDQVADRLGAGYTVYTRQDVAAKRSADAGVLSIVLATLGMTVTTVGAVASCSTLGRLRSYLRQSAGAQVATQGRRRIRRMMVYDRLIGFATATTAGAGLVIGTLVLLAGSGADLPCLSVFAISSTLMLLPLAAYGCAMVLAPIPALLRSS